MAGAIAVTAEGAITDDLTTYTISGAAIGVAAADRVVLAGVSWREGSATDRTLNSATIAGNAAVILAQAHIGGHGGAIIGLEVPTGTTADITLTFSGANSRIVYGVARAVGIDWDGGTPADTVAQTGVQTTGDQTRAMDIDTVTDGVVFAWAGGGTVTTLNISFVGTGGLTEGTQQSAEVCRGIAGTADIATGQTPRDIDAFYDTGVADDVFGMAEVAVSFGPAPDVTAPVLSNAAATATGETTASLAVDTDEGNGTLFWVVTTSASPPSAAQVAAGQDHTGAAAVDSDDQAVAGTGTQSVAGGASGLTAGTNYWAYFVQDDAAANRSNVASDAFTTDSPPADGDGGPIPGRTEGPAGGARRRRYPFANPIDDPHLRHSVEAYHGPQKPPAEPELPAAPEKPSERAPAARKPAGLSQTVKAEKPAVEPPRAVAEPAAAPVVADQRVAALEAEVEALRTQVDELKAERRDDDEEQRLLAMLLEDKED